MDGLFLSFQRLVKIFNYGLKFKKYKKALSYRHDFKKENVSMSLCRVKNKLKISVY